MRFHFVYVEDMYQHRKRMEEAVRQFNAGKGPVFLELTLAENVEKFRQYLESSTNVDLVLADIYYKVGGTYEDRLSDIIAAVKSCGSKDDSRAPIPIISYTRYHADSLQSCLDREKDLFDIWDKGSASPAYVVWRLSRLAIDLSGIRPDTYLQRLITDMPPGARWHALVQQMPDGYGKVQTEAGQIRSLGSKILSISQRNDMYPAAEEMWEVVTRWEQLSRAVSSKVRGHARHVVNVFWMGYYLIHHPLLRDRFSQAWETALKQRREILNQISKSPIGNDEFKARYAVSLAELVGHGQPCESLSDAWFLSGLFHDVASCVPKYPELRTVGQTLIGRFGCLDKGLERGWIPSQLKKEGNDLLQEFDGESAIVASSLWDQSVDQGHPDHGVFAAQYIRNRMSGSPQISVVLEATRAIALHNIIGEDAFGEQKVLKWRNDPLGCLLVMCDQVQTWDRERGDEDIYGPDFPSRAQLTSLDISDGSKPKLSMVIEYFMPKHLLHSPALYERVKQDLERTLGAKPIRALRRIDSDWPFEIDVKCLLSGKELDNGIHFG